MGVGCAALFPAARNRLRAGRQFQLRRAGRPLQLRSRERPGQSGQPHADHDPAVSRGRDSGARAATRRSPRVGRDGPKPRSTAFDAFEFSKGLEHIWSMISAVDKFIVEHAPWKLAKDRGDAAELDERSTPRRKRCASICALVHPVLPDCGRRSGSSSACTEPLETSESDALLGRLAAGQKIGEDRAGVSRASMRRRPSRRCRNSKKQRKTRQAALLGRRRARAAGESRRCFIAIDDFARSILRVGEVMSAEPVKGADKLLHLKVDIGEAGAAHHRGGHRAGLRAGATRRTQGGDRRQPAAAQAARHRIERHDRGGSLEGGKPVLAGFHEDMPVGARLK